MLITVSTICSEVTHRHLETSSSTLIKTCVLITSIWVGWGVGGGGEVSQGKDEFLGARTGSWVLTKVLMAGEVPTVEEVRLLVCPASLKYTPPLPAARWFTWAGSQPLSFRQR